MEHGILKQSLVSFSDFRVAGLFLEIFCADIDCSPKLGFSETNPEKSRLTQVGYQCIENFPVLGMMDVVLVRPLRRNGIRGEDHSEQVLRQLVVVGRLQKYRGVVKWWKGHLEINVRNSMTNCIISQRRFILWVGPGESVGGEDDVCRSSEGGFSKLFRWRMRS